MGGTPTLQVPFLILMGATLLCYNTIVAGKHAHHMYLAPHRKLVEV